MNDPVRLGGRWQAWAFGAVFWTMLGLLSFSYRFLDTVTRGHDQPFQIKLIEELTGAWGAGLLAVGVARVTRVLRGRGVLFLLHVPAILVYSALHTTWNWGTRAVAFPLAGLGAYDYGTMGWRYLMELGNDVFGYGVIVLAVTFLDQQRERQRQALQVMALEAEVSQARLIALEARLQPHFLFNALNTISGVMYEDVTVADRMLHRLSRLLRRTLDSSASLVTLREELATAELWSSIMTARFADTLRFEQQVESQAFDVLVPTLLLQPLLENAVRHGSGTPGDAAVAAPLIVRIVARRHGDHLELAIHDNGVGWQSRESTALTSGVGLSTTVRRLRTLYGDDASLNPETAIDGGAVVCVRIPWQVDASIDRSIDVRRGASTEIRAS